MTIAQRHLAVLLALGLLMGSILGSSPANAQVAPISPWDSIQGNARWKVGPHDVRAPSGSPAVWRQRRQALGVATQSVAFTGRSLIDAHALIQQFIDEALIGWEIALIAANSRTDLIPPALAADWIDLLQRWPDLADEQRVQQHLSLRLRAQNSGLAMAPPACLAGELRAAQWMVDLAAIEDSIPGRRLRSRTEPPPIIPRESSAAALTGVDRQSAIASLALVALTSPSAPVLARFGVESALQDEHCALRIVRLHFGMLLRPATDWPALASELSALSENVPVSDRWLWRFAVHRYLLGDAPAVEALAAYFGLHYPTDTEGLRYMMLLADLADGTLNAADTSSTSARSGSNPTYRWVSAEAARIRGETELAEKALSELMDMDVHFVAGWLSLAASRSTLGRGRDVRLALDALLEIAPPLPVYDYWISTLGSRRLP